MSLKKPRNMRGKRKKRDKAYHEKFALLLVRDEEEMPKRWMQVGSTDERHVALVAGIGGVEAIDEGFSQLLSETQAHLDWLFHMSLSVLSF